MDKILLIIYLLAVLLLTICHDFTFFYVSALVLFLLSGKEIINILKKTLYAILLFNSIVTVSYIIFALLGNQFFLQYVLRINLRVFVLTYLSFFMMRRINPFKAFSFSQSLSLLLTITSTQILSFKALFKDCKLAFKSRRISSPSLKDLYYHASSMVLFFLNKSLNNSKEIAQAMKSRGFLND